MKHVRILGIAVLSFLVVSFRFSFSFIQSDYSCRRVMSPHSTSGNFTLKALSDPAVAEFVSIAATDKAITSLEAWANQLMEKGVRELAEKYMQEAARIRAAEQYSIFTRNGVDIAYIYANSELGTLEIRPIPGSLMTREEVYAAALEYVDEAYVSRGKGVELIMPDGDLMKKMLVAEGRDIPFSQGISSDLHVWGEDKFLQLEFGREGQRRALLTFKESSLEGTGGVSMIIQPKITVLVNGYGTIGSRDADALRRAGFYVVVAKRSFDARAVDLHEMGFPFYISEDTAERRAEFEKRGYEVLGSVEGLLKTGAVDLVIDCSPSKKGAENAEKLYKPYGVRYVLQGGEKDKAVEISFSSRTQDWNALAEAVSVRVVSCNTTAMTRIYGPLLEYYAPGVLRIDNLALRRAADPGQGGEEGMVDAVTVIPAYHHGPDFLTALSPELRGRIAPTSVVTDAGQVPTTHFHLHLGTVYALAPTYINAKEVEAILAKEGRVAVVHFPGGEFDSAQLFEIISAQLKQPDPYVIIAQVTQLPEGRIRIVYTVPQENDVVPENVNAAQAMFGLWGKTAGVRLVDEVLGIDWIKPAIESRLP